MRSINKPWDNFQNWKLVQLWYNFGLLKINFILFTYRQWNVHWLSCDYVRFIVTVIHVIHFWGRWPTCMFIFWNRIRLIANPDSILYKSTADRYRPVSYPDGPISARCRFIKNADWEVSRARKTCFIQPVLCLLTRRFLFCILPGSFNDQCLLYNCLFLIPYSFGASGRLFSMIVT